MDSQALFVMVMVFLVCVCVCLIVRYSGVKDHSLEGRDELFLGDGVVVACDAGEEGFHVVLAVGSVEAAVEAEHYSLGLALRNGTAVVGVNHLEDSERCV